MTVRGRPEVLFLCVHNAGRSQMAAAFARHMAGDRVVVHSAGSDPAETLNATVVDAMRELDIDISDESPKKLTESMGHRADVIVTMGCGDSCPVYVGEHHVDWDLEDPNGKGLGTVRSIRDEIRRRVAELIKELLD